MEKHGLASKQSRGRLGTALFCEQSQAKSTERERERVKELESKAGRESALGNLKLILNCLENHHAASSSAFDGRKKPAAFFPLQDLFSPPAVKQIRQRRSCSWYNFRGKGRANCWLGAKRDEACFSCLLWPAPDNVSLASSKTGTHGGLCDSLRPLVPTLVCLHSARHLGGQEVGCGRPEQDLQEQQISMPAPNCPVILLSVRNVSSVGIVQGRSLVFSCCFKSHHQLSSKN